MARTKTQGLNIYRGKAHLQLGQLKFESYGDPVESGQDYLLFLKSVDADPPEWMAYLDPILTRDHSIYNRSSGFIYAADVDGRIYFISSGPYWQQLSDLVDESYGVELALRLINDKDLKALSQQNIQGATKNITRTVLGYTPSADRENYLRILDQLKGRGTFSNLSCTIEGSKSIKLRTTRPIVEFPALVSELNAVLKQPPKLDFPESFSQVTDDALIYELERQLIKEIDQCVRRIKEPENLYLEAGAPTYLNSDDYTLFINGEPIKISSFEIGDVINGLISGGKKSINGIDELVGENAIRCADISGEVILDDTIWSLLVFDTSHLGKDYFLYKKTWYEILPGVKQFYEDQLGIVKVLDPRPFPTWDSSTHHRESAYNREVQRVNQMHGWVLMDAKNVPISNEGRSKLELADIYDPQNKVFYHVKRGSGAVLSYLFMQGFVAGEHFYQSGDFRSKAKAKFGISDAEFTVADNPYTIAYGIAHAQALAPEFPKNLSFFAKSNLVHAARELNGLGYKVQIFGIEWRPRVAGS